MSNHSQGLILWEDIVKVRLQTTQQYRNALDCATKILKDEGPLAFYKVIVWKIAMLA